MSDGNTADHRTNAPKMFREVFDLADKLVERITDAEVEARLRQLRERLEQDLSTPGRSTADGCVIEAPAVISTGEAALGFANSARVPDYEVVLGPAAARALLGLDLMDRKELADALGQELAGGPNADKEHQLQIDRNGPVYDDPGVPDGGEYRATPLSFGGYVAVHRCLTGKELGRLRWERIGFSVADHGFYVADILPANAAFSRRHDSLS
jgi:hypothetical protein